MRLLRAREPLRLGQRRSRRRDGRGLLVNWTVDHLAESGADFDLVLGAWGEDTTSADRVCVSLLYRKPEDHPWSVMVIDADHSKRIGGEIADSGLRRDEVIGTPLAPHVFAVIDAIFLQDGRLFM